MVSKHVENRATGRRPYLSERTPSKQVKNIDMIDVVLENNVLHSADLALTLVDEQSRSKSASGLTRSSHTREIMYSYVAGVIAKNEILKMNIGK
jgi:hypothetical protein